MALRTKRLNVRQAHCASATRFINQVNGAVQSNDAHQLRQLKQSLSDKLTVLTKLDNETIELVEVSEPEAEVEQADEVREKIGSAILTTEDALVIKKNKWPISS